VSCDFGRRLTSRNNHIDKHYNELRDLTLNDKSLKLFDVRLVGIVWDVESQPYHRLLRMCSERVVQRGDNHQTLRPDLTMEAEHEAVVGQFLRNWTAPDPQLFDDLISVQVEDTPRQALIKIVDGLVHDLGLIRPSQEDIDNALVAAKEYKVTTPYHAPAVRVGKAIRYFGVAPEINLPATVKTILSSHSDSSATTLFQHLRTVNRVTAKPHITLAHEKRVAAEKEAHPEDDTPGPLEFLWNTCKSLAESTSSSLYAFDITMLVWDDRVMALALDHIHPKEAGTGPDLVLPEEISLYLHVTVGTRDEETSAFESRDIVRIARQAIAAGAKGEKGEAAEAVEGGGKVRWLRVEGVSSEGRVRGMF
jgi:tRNA ligase